MRYRVQLPQFGNSAVTAVRDEFARLQPGKIAAVITHLEMLTPARLAPSEAPEGISLGRVKNPDLDWYRTLYRRVGENWLWFSRLVLDDRALRALIHDPGVEVHSLRHRESDQGILELDTRRFPDIEISFLGLAAGLIGRGAGRFLINRALESSWVRKPRRVTIHTCTLDHPRALEFYLRSGFSPYARSLEIADDPRLSGLLPRTAAPHVPILDR